MSAWSCFYFLSVPSLAVLACFLYISQCLFLQPSHAGDRKRLRALAVRLIPRLLPGDECLLADLLAQLIFRPLGAENEHGNDEQAAATMLQEKRLLTFFLERYCNNRGALSSLDASAEVLPVTAFDPAISLLKPSEVRERRTLHLPCPTSLLPTSCTWMLSYVADLYKALAKQQATAQSPAGAPKPPPEQLPIQQQASWLALLSVFADCTLKVALASLGRAAVRRLVTRRGSQGL